MKKRAITVFSSVTDTKTPVKASISMVIDRIRSGDKGIKEITESLTNLKGNDCITWIEEDLKSVG